MSVLIKGMKMPKNCDACPMLYEYRFCALTDDHASSIEWKMEEKRMPNCPLIEIPDHGDLIDRDALIDVLYHGSKKISEIQRGVKDEKTISYCQGIMVGYANSRIALHVAPVVIPAERSEDE